MLVNRTEELMAKIWFTQIHRFNLPLVIHTREAWEETFTILDTEGVPKSTVFHCFTGGKAEANECLERGAYLSFSGIITFKKSELLREAASECPIDRAMIETDSPYLTPPCRSSFVLHIIFYCCLGIYLQLVLFHI